MFALVRRHALVLALSIPYVLLAPAARAEPTPAESAPEEERTRQALALFQEGSKLLQQGDARGSLAPLEASMKLMPSPNTELLVGHALRQLGQTARAVERYESARAAAGLRVAAGERRFAPTLSDAGRWIAALSPKVAQLSIHVPSAPPGSKLFVGDREIAWSPEQSGEARAARTYEEPGKHRVELRADIGVVAKAEVNLEKGEARLLTLRADGSTAPATGSTEPAESDGGIKPPPVAAWIAGGIGAAGMISFAVSGGLALSAASELDDCAPNCDPNNPSLQESRDEGKRSALVANVSVAIGAAGLATGALLWIFWPEAEPPGVAKTERPTLDMRVGPASFELQGRF